MFKQAFFSFHILFMITVILQYTFCTRGSSSHAFDASISIPSSLDKRFALGIDQNLRRKFVSIRAGAGKVISGEKKSSPFQSILKLLEGIKPATRSFLVLSLLCTITEALGLPAEALFSLRPTRLLEVWRIFTSKVYLGFSMSMANNLYFFIKYGQELESINGTAYYAWFLITQTILLTIFGLILGFPFQAKSMIAATIYCSCHMNPLESLRFQFGIIITAWQLPFCLMAIDCLSAQSMAAAWPHVLGIATGHIFHFFNVIWPGLGGRAWLAPPSWFTSRFGSRPISNVDGLNRKSSEKDKISTKSKKVKIGKGRKIGESRKK